MEENCSLAFFNKIACHGPRIFIDQLSNDDQELLCLRTRHSSHVKDLCFIHKSQLLDKYEIFNRKKCCDPFQKHKKIIQQVNFTTFAICILPFINILWV